MVDRLGALQTISGRLPCFERLRNAPDPISDLLIRRAMPDIRSAGFLGQDNATTGALEPSSVTISEQAIQDLASVGFAYVGMSRLLTDTGQWAIDRIRAYNPDFRFLAYWNYGHVRASDAGPARPLDSDEYSLLTPFRARDINGEDVVAWFEGGNPANPVAAYWVNYSYPQNGGKFFNRQLIDDQVQGLAAAIAAVDHKPDGVKVDYLNLASSGYYVWPTANDEVDLEQQGTAYGDDPAQQASFLDAQEYFLDQLAAEMGDDFVIVANGRAAYPGLEPTIANRLHGWFIEGFPTSPLYPDPAECFAFLWAAYQDPGQYRDYAGRHAAIGMPVFQTDLKPIYGLTSMWAKAGRMAALLFGGTWRHQPTDGTGDIVEADIVDETWDAELALLGQPTGAVQLFGTAGVGVHTYQRAFEGGTVLVSLNAGLSGISQVLVAQVVPS